MEWCNKALVATRQQGSRACTNAKSRERMLYKLLLLTLLAICGYCRDDGMALTPPMGWLAWERFRCNTDCDNDPDNCISERLFMKMADIMAENGYLAAGYQYVNVDECWTATERDEQGRLQPDPKRFPNGMEALGRYIHSKGLKYGLYTDYGTRTCNGQYPGSKDHLQIDAQTFADWGADYLKMDGCYDDPPAWTKFGYPDIAYWLNQTGRPIVLGTEFPYYEIRGGYPPIGSGKYGSSLKFQPHLRNDSSVVPDYKSLSKVCHVARNYDDIQDSWDSMLSIIQIYADNAGDFAGVAGPGFWNDPDELLIGNFGLSFEQQKVQMALWCLWSSPLLMSVDLRVIRDESREILLNRGAIAINQDPLGVQGTLVKKIGKNIQLWTKKLTAVSPSGQTNAYAMVVLNLGDDGMPRSVSFQLNDLGLNNEAGYVVTEVFSGMIIDKFLANATISVHVNPSGVFFGKATPL